MSPSEMYERGRTCGRGFSPETEYLANSDSGLKPLPQTQMQMLRNCIPLYQGIRTVASAVLLCLALAGCATSQPVREHRPGDTPVAGTDEDELWYAMQRAENELKQSPLLVRDPALNAYVRELTCKVAAQHCRDLRVYIMDVPEFNASMAPNGMMIVWTGALLRARDEAEIGFVLGHEAGHFTAQHSIRQWRRLKDTSAVLSAFQLVAYGAGVPDAALLTSRRLCRNL
jgi:beta-barrel assembly-enhancing protease